MIYKDKPVERKVDLAIRLLQDKDYPLLVVNSSERSIAHRLACYLENEFKGYNVDCEYNRNEQKPKMLMRTWGKNKKFRIKKDVYPDIIVHKRGNNKNNLLVIEIKKTSNKSQKERDLDLLKLKAYMHKGDDYQYKYGMFIDFFVRGDFKKPPTKKFFKDFREINFVSKYFGKV